MPAIVVKPQKRRIEPSRNSPGYVNGETGTVQAVSPVVIEATISETHAKTAEVTTHPVEDGADITDYVRTGVLGIEIEAAFSAQPMNCRNDEPDGVFSGDSETRVPAAWDAFLNLIDGKPRRELLQVSTGLKLYDNMVLTSIGTTQDASNPHSIIIRAALQQVRIVRSAFTTVPARQIASGQTRNSASGTVQAGEQNAQEVADCSDCAALCENCIVENDDFIEGETDPSLRFTVNADCADDVNTQIDVTTNDTAAGERLRQALCEKVTPPPAGGGALGIALGLIMDRNIAVPTGTQSGVGGL